MAFNAQMRWASLSAWAFHFLLRRWAMPFLGPAPVGLCVSSVPAPGGAFYRPLRAPYGPPEAAPLPSPQAFFAAALFCLGLRCSSCHARLWTVRGL